MAAEKLTEMKEEVPEMNLMKLPPYSDDAVAESGEVSFVGMKKKKKKKPVETDENGDAGEDLSGDQIGEVEEGEGIVLGGA